MALAETPATTLAPLPDAPRSIKRRSHSYTVKRAAFPNLSLRLPGLYQRAKIGRETTSFTVTTTININTTAIPVR